MNVNVRLFKAWVAGRMLDVRRRQIEDGARLEAVEGLSMTQEVHRAIAPSLVEALNKLFANRVFASGSQLAAVLGLSVKTLSRLGDAGKIGWRPKGSSKQPHRNYAREDVEAYLRGERPCPYTYRAVKTAARAVRTTSLTSVSSRRGRQKVNGFTAARARRLLE
jgi:hypothetical protein